MRLHFHSLRRESGRGPHALRQYEGKKNLAEPVMSRLVITGKAWHASRAETCRVEPQRGTVTAGGSS